MIQVSDCELIEGNGGFWVYPDSSVEITRAGSEIYITASEALKLLGILKRNKKAIKKAAKEQGDMNYSRIA